MAGANDRTLNAKAGASHSAMLYKHGAPSSFLGVRFKSDEVSDAGEFSGYGSTFGNIDRGGDVCVAGCFAQTLKAMQDSGTMPAMLWSHDTSEPIGEWLEMVEDSAGLKVRGKLWIDGPNPVAKAMQVHRLLKSNGPKGLSIGYIPRDAAFGEQDGRRVRLLKAVDLVELSPTVFPMNPAATVTDAKAGQLTSAEDWRDMAAAVARLTSAIKGS
jgi:HK97 family phage prohead protease